MNFQEALDAEYRKIGRIQSEACMAFLMTKFTEDGGNASDEEAFFAWIHEGNGHMWLTKDGPVLNRDRTAEVL